jgi:multicomponent Na+:H+ antiporter subunit G
MNGFFVNFFLFLSGMFILLASFGLKRFPDLYCRMHATCKASTVAKVFSFGAAAIYFWNVEGVFIKLIGTVVFILLTAPVSAHLIARAGYKRGATPSDKTWHDEYARKS